MARKIDLLIEGGRVVAGGAVREATVAIAGERIAGLLEPGLEPPGVEGARRIDASGKIVMPGVVDAHVHFKNFNRQTDSFNTVSVAAVFGGVTTVIPFAQGTVGMPVREFLTRIREEGEAESLVDFAFHCRLQAPERGVTRQFDDAIELGATSFKMFMAYRDRGIMWDDHSLMEALEYIGERGGIFCCHAENGDVIDYLEKKYRAAGRFTPENFLATRPVEAEAEATFRILRMASLARCPLYLVHMSTEWGVRLAREARAEGQKVWIETCPQYATLTQDDTTRLGSFLKIAPPAARAKRCGCHLEGDGRGEHRRGRVRPLAVADREQEPAT